MAGIQLDGKIALVTGASRGIGAVVACRLAQAGAKVGVNYHTSSGAAEIIVNSINESGGDALLVGGDVSQEDNAEKVVKFLESQKKVKNVIYPTNHQGEIRERAKRYMKGGYGSLVGMDLGTKEAGAKFIDNLKLLYHVANIGDARSLAIHPASTTHSQLNDKQLAEAGVTPGYVRLSIGIEHPDDIIADIEQALAA